MRLPVHTADGQLLSVGALTVLIGRHVAVDKSFGPITTGAGPAPGVGVGFGCELKSASWVAAP